jgi:hypothetical protein
MDEKMRCLLATVFGLTAGRLANGVAAEELAVLLKWDLTDVRDASARLAARGWTDTSCHEWGDTLYLTARGADEAECLGAIREPGIQRSVSPLQLAEMVGHGS